MPASDQSSATAKVCRQPISSEAMNAPASEPMPPTTTTTKMIGPTAAAMPGSVTKALPPMTPASPASARAAAEHQHEHARHVVAERLDRLRVRERGLDHQADARAREQRARSPTSIATDTSIMKPR